MNNNKILFLTARITSILFHPLLIPTLGFLLLFNSGLYFTLIPLAMKKMVLLVVLLSTCIFPALSIGFLGLSSKFDLGMNKNSDRVIPLILSSIFYYSGYLVLRHLPIFPIFSFFLVASILVQIALLLISLKWKISTHSAAIGGLLGGFLALSFLFQENPLLILIALVFISGLVGTSRLILEKHTNLQVYSGFLLGFGIMNLIFFFI
jgi:membrane-associated phospholipid phosphatase